METSIAVISALQEEIDGLKQRLLDRTTHTIAGIDVYRGFLEGRPVTAAVCGVGKVNAALCTQLLIDHYAPAAVINPGVAGGIDPRVEIGDMVVSSAACYHDFDTTALGNPPGVIYGMQTSCFPAERSLQLLAGWHARNAVGAARTHVGLVVSGDQFVADTTQRQRIWETFGASCTEMEGAAVAHVCWRNNTPFVIIRAVSDRADSSATESFDDFLTRAMPSLDHVTVQTLLSWNLSQKVSGH